MSAAGAVDDRCGACGFDWTMPAESGIAAVAGCAEAYAAALAGGDPRPRPAPDVWSPAEYTWHLVDVLAIGTERLVTLRVDPAAGIAVFDEGELARARHYDALSPAVAPLVLARVAGGWVEAARRAPAGARAAHPEWGTASRLEVLRRNAHEVHHHLGDVEAGLARGAGGPR